MSYTKNTWATGDVVTSAKLNKLEEGVRDVNGEYVPTVWATGDVVTADKLNKLEQGVADASGGAVFTSSIVLTTSQSANNPRTYVVFEKLARITSTGISSNTINSIADGPPSPATVTTLNAVISSSAPQEVTIYAQNEENISVTLTGDITFIEEEPDGVQVSISGAGTITVVVDSSEGA